MVKKIVYGHKKFPVLCRYGRSPLQIGKMPLFIFRGRQGQPYAVYTRGRFKIPPSSVRDEGRRPLCIEPLLPIN